MAAGCEACTWVGIQRVNSHLQTSLLQEGKTVMFKADHHLTLKPMKRTLFLTLMQKENLLVVLVM